MNFIDELKRRKVIRVGITYAVVAFVIMQLVEIIFPIFQIPLWASQFVIILLLISFPVTLILAWIFDRTPEGIVRTASTVENAENAESDTRSLIQKKRTWFAVTGIAFGIAVGVFGPKMFSGDSDATNQIRKMAILPFSNMRPDPETDFLGYALSDEIINRLGYLKSIVVRPSGAVRKSQGAQTDLDEVGDDLDVELVLTGSFLHEGDQLRLSTELIDLDKNERLWNKTMTVDYDNIFEIQESVSRDIVDGLKYNLEPEEEDFLLVADVAPEAYELYLKGREMPFNDIPTGKAKISILQESIEMDSTYADSWGLLGKVCTTIAQASEKGSFYLDLAQNAILRALELNNESLIAIDAASTFFAEVGDVEKATEMGIRSTKLSGGAVGFPELGYALRYAGLMKESIATYDRSIILDESILNRGGSLVQKGKSFIYLGDYEDARIIMHDGISALKEANVSSSAVALIYEGMPYLYLGSPEKAYPYFDFISETDPTNSWSIFGQIYKAVTSGKHDQGKRLVQKVESRNIHDSEMIYRFTHFYLMLGEQSKALDALEKSVDKGFFCYPYIKSDPLTKPLHNHPRFKTIVEKARIRHELYEKRFGEEIRLLLGMTS